jgi:hypothetical protein
MTTFSEARAAVEEYLQSHTGELPEEDALVILEEKTIERSWGWVFFYTSRLWQQTGELRYALGGNAPVFVERQSLRIWPTGTALPIEHYIANFERTGNPSA